MRPIDEEKLIDWLGEAGFEELQTVIAAEIYDRQATTLEDAPNWDTVVFNRGWCSALAYVSNLRNVYENIKKNDEGEFEDGDQTV